ncbi:glycoside hydrolase family 73 protein [Paenibacillus sp. TAB 01]|uniref:glycoside hydrolase family 73 protein n=1 Tax=Paenibacillus sp. TAB 01 TaxID=3368988 RepID=UPI0037509ABE
MSTTPQEAFIAQISDYAVMDMVRTVLLGKPVLASYTIAQACLESAYGRSAANGNYFGIKGSGTVYTTVEYIFGQWITTTASFASYNSLEASVIAHSQFLMENSRYTASGVFKAGEERDYKAAANALQKAGYATDPSYASKLIAIIEKYGLDAYDKEADEMLSIITQLQNQLQVLEKTVESHTITIQNLKERATMTDVPDWAQGAVDAAVAAGLIDTPKGGSYDFYRVLTVFHRKGLF